MFLLNGRPLQLDTPFEHDGVQYPANWLRLASPEDRAAIGITEVTIQPRPDDRFYWVDGPALDGTWSTIPKDLDGLKKQWSAQFKQTAWSMLASSDWMVVRKQENGTAIPAEWTTYREGVRQTCALAIEDIGLKTNIEDFIAAVMAVQWPTSPDSQLPGA